MNVNKIALFALCFGLASGASARITNYWVGASGNWGDPVPGGVLEEFAISKTMKPVTWSPDMRWWYKDEFERLFPPKQPVK